MIISILYYKCKRNAKSDFSLSFTNQTFNRSTPRPGSSLVPRIQEPEQELNTVTIVRRGNTTGYDNPGFDSPWARAYEEPSYQLWSGRTVPPSAPEMQLSVKAVLLLQER